MKSLLALAASIGALWALAGYLIADLPEVIPVHFDFTGKPDRLSGRGSYWTLPAVGTVVSALLVGIAHLTPRLARKSPERMNIPDKAAFLALLPEERVRAVRPIAIFLHVLNFVVTAVLLSGLVDVHRVATGRATHIFPYAFLAILLTVIIGIPWLIYGSRAVVSKTRTGA